MRLKIGLAATFVILLTSLSSLAQESHVGNLVGNAKKGKALYQRYCIFCHGKYGDGTGGAILRADEPERLTASAVTLTAESARGKQQEGRPKISNVPLVIESCSFSVFR